MRDTRIWEVGMKKKLILVMALLCCLVLVVGILAACNGDEGTQPDGQTPGNSSAYAGRYYEQVNGNLNADSWIELGDDWSWTDSDTMMGTFTVKGSNIYFYWMTTSEPMFGGTISNGELTIDLYGTYYTYKQGTPSVDKPEDPDKEDPDDEKPEEPEEPEEEYFTVTFNVNGGDSAISSREYLAGALMSLPTPTRDGYRFLGWYDAMGQRYDNTSVMPDNDLTLTARWEIVVSSYEDEYVYFKPATEGKKQPSNFYYPFQDAGIHHYIYVELESDNIGGPNAVGDKNNLDLASRVDMEFSVEDGYTLTWYNDSSFTSINGAQMFTLDYGSNVYFLTVSEGTRVVQRYLIDFYIKHDYYINLYHDIYATRPYDKVRVVEGELLPDDIRQSVTSGLEFDKWVYRNVEASEYVEFDFSTPIREDWSLYQTFKPKKITADLDGGTLNEDIYVTPYEAGHKLPVPTKEGYDFIGWQLPGYDDVMRAYFADRYGNNVSKMLGSGGGAMDDVYFDTLKAVWLPKQFAMQERGDAVSFEATQADITYADDEHVNIESIQYLLSGSSAYIPADKLYGYGEEVTLTAVKTGYTFLGWYYGEEKVTDALTYEFIMPAENVTYTAKWVFYTVSLEKTEGGSVGLNAIDRDSADISFDLNGAGGIAPVTQTVTREVGLVYPEIPAYRGHVFAGWYDNSGCEGSPFDFSVPVTKDVTLYAKWISYSGSGVIPYNGSLTVDVVSKSSSTKHYYAFVPLVSGNISVYSNGGMSDTYGTLYDSNKRQLTYDDDSGDGNNFKITYSVTAGRLYYIVPAGYNSSGTTTVYLSGDMPDAGGSLLLSGDDSEPIKITVGKRVKLMATTNSGYTFIGWYNGEEKVTDALTYEFTMTAENVTYTAKWIKVTVVSEDASKGTVSGLTETYLPGDKVSVTATTNSGYTFIGWYNGEEKVTDALTYEFTMTAENVTYTAKWIKVAIVSEDTSKGTVSGLTETYLPGDEVSVAASTNPGYTFIGWYNGDEKLTDTLTYEFTMPAENVTYTAKWIKAAIVSEDTSKGTVSQLIGTYFPGDDVSVTATTKSGYTFIGWYNGDEKVADGLTYEFTMPEENVTYTAKWIKVTVESEDTAKGTVSQLTDTYVFGEEVSVTATTNLGYTFIGWYNGDEKVADTLTYKFEMPAENVTYTAKWMMNAEMEPFVFTSTQTSLSITGVNTKDATSLTIPSYVTHIGSDAFSGCNALASIEVDVSNTTYASVDGILYNKAKTVFVHIPDAITGDVEIPGGVTSIANYAFSGCSNLTSITIPDSVTSIGSGAFSGCSSLESITIPFVGDEAGKTSSDTYQYPFGYIFGTSSYDGGTAVEQTYYGSSTSSTTSTTYYIPSSLRSVTVTGGNILYGAFYNCSMLTSVTIGNGVTSIGRYAFYDCTSLESITIPDSVTSVGSYAFYDCTAEIVWGDDPEITEIGYYAFSRYKGTSITIPNSVTSIGEYAFYGCSSLTSITIGGGVTSIERYAFDDCTSLESITIPDSVTSIGDRAFRGCSSLESITIPFVGDEAGKTSSDTYQYPFGYIFGTSSYDGGTAVEQTYHGSSTSSTTYDDYYIPSSLRSVTVTGGSILYGAFYGCSMLTLITIPDSVTSIGDRAFSGCISLTSITIPDSVTSIGYQAFYGCTGLTSITIPDSVTSIGSGAFSGCSSLESITIPFVGDEAGKTSSDTYQYPFGYIFGTSSYDGGTAVEQTYYGSSTSSTTSTTYYIPSSLRSVTVTGGNILYGAFYNCSMLTSVTIRNGVMSIGDYAFRICSGLTSITIPDSVTSIGEYAFLYCRGLTSVTIPDSVTSIGSSAFAGCSGLTSVTIGEGVTSIGYRAFRDCYKLVEVYNKSSLNIVAGSSAYGYVGYYAKNVYKKAGGSWFTDTADGFRFFYDGEQGYLMGYYGSETEIDLPASFAAYDRTLVKSYAIYNYAFYECSGLTSVTIPDSVTSIGEYAFSYCTGLTSITIPDSVTSIGKNAFYGCSGLTSVTIPDSVTSIEEWAFSGCSGLTSVSFEGTKAEWNAITKGNGWKNNSPFTEVVCSDGTVSV